MSTSRGLERIFRRTSFIGCLVSTVFLLAPNTALSQERNFAEELRQMGQGLKGLSKSHGLNDGENQNIDSKNPGPSATSIGDKWAIVMGSSHFQDPTIPGYKTGAKNAADFASFLTNKCNFSADHVQALVEESASKSKFLNLVGDTFLPRYVRNNDLLVLYFSGYVSSPKEDIGGSTFFCTYDTKRSAIYSTGLEMQLFSRMLRERIRNNAKTVIIFDTKPLPSTSTNKSPGADEPHDIDNIKSGHVVYISGALTGSESRDARNGGNSEFLKAFMQSLMKAGPEATLDKVFGDTKEVVQTAVRKDYGAGADQTPQIGGDANIIKSILLMAPPSVKQEEH